MKVIIDARWIFSEISGIGLYTLELLRALSALDRDTEYTLLFSDEALKWRTIKDLNLDSTPNFRSEIVSHGVFSVQSQLLLPGYLKEAKADVFHSPNYMIPMRAFPARRKGRTACVITIHDLIPLLFPDHAPKSKKSRMMPLYRFIMRQVSARADTILTVSRNSADDICRMLLPKKEDHSKVVPVFNGVSDAFRKLVWKPSNAPQKLLYVGRLDPYKNVTGLMRIFDKVRKNTSQDVKLVIAGSQDSRYPEPMELCRRLSLGNDVEWTGYLTTVELLQLYTSSTVLVHPSIYEGFGLPVIEAMAAGLPVVCSSAGSLAEVAGDAACVHDYDDEQGFVDSISAILNSTARARELSRLGKEQAKKFSWQSTAAQTLDVYRNAAQKD